MFLHYLRLFRVCVVSGRYGGGKTSLAVKLALDLSYPFVASNFSLRLPGYSFVDEASSFHDIASSLSSVVIIYDEAWQDLGLGASPRAVRSYLSYLRKRDQILILPSVLPLVRQVQVLQAWRHFNGMVFGLPLWWYKYRLAVSEFRNKRDVFSFYWWFPSRVFSFYDSREIPSSEWYVYERVSTEVSSSASVGCGGSGGDLMLRGFHQAFGHSCNSGSFDQYSDADQHQYTDADSDQDSDSDQHQYADKYQYGHAFSDKYSASASDPRFRACARKLSGIADCDSCPVADACADVYPHS